MDQKKIYIAGPDVFMKNAKEIGERYKQICTKYGFIGLYPLDNEVTGKNLSKPSLSAKIFKANCAQIRDADCIIANLNDFRGYGMDDGTAWEIGYAYTFGKYIIGYSDDASSMVDRWGQKTIEDTEVEDFDAPVNLMIANACDSIVQGSFEDAVRTLLK